MGGRRRSPSGGNGRIDCYCLVVYCLVILCQSGESNQGRGVCGVDIRTRSWVGETYCKLVIYFSYPKSSQHGRFEDGAITLDVCLF